jgi:simple sugar transport system ATP-binding protein
MTETMQSPIVQGAVSAVPRGTELLRLDDASKYFGTVIALEDVSMDLKAGEVHALLGDNGAGKSTLIKILSGVYQQDKGRYIVGGEEVHFTSPRDALAKGIATVYQDLAMIPLMGVSRNFFLGQEPTKGWGPFKRFDLEAANTITREELHKMGIEIRDPEHPVGTLSGGERQSVAIARAVYFGARVLILDEPTAALGVKEAAVVLRYIAQARARDLGVVFITHNVHHAYPIADRFTILNRGRSYGTFDKRDVTREQVVQMMAGGEDLEALGHELEEFARQDLEQDLSEIARSSAATDLTVGQALVQEGRTAERASARAKEIEQRSNDGPDSRR